MNNYKQFYWSGGVLWSKGYYKNAKDISYQEKYIGINVGIKYIL